MVKTNHCFFVKLPPACLILPLSTTSSVCSNFNCVRKRDSHLPAAQPSGFLLDCQVYSHSGNSKEKSDGCFSSHSAETEQLWLFQAPNLCFKSPSCVFLKHLDILSCTHRFKGLFGLHHRILWMLFFFLRPPLKSPMLHRVHITGAFSKCTVCINDLCVYHCLQLNYFYFYLLY